MTQKKKILCPMCSTEMNHHADKVNFLVPETDTEYYNEIYGGILEEHHKCPNCGFSLALMVKEENEI